MADEKLEMGETRTSLMSPEPTQAPVSPPNKFEKLYQPCVGELVGTMFFVLIGCVSVIENVESTGRLQPALVHGLAVAVLVACMAEISGSHFNPPFTLAIYLCGAMEMKMVAPYLVCQLVGGVIGAALAKAMTSRENYAKAHGAAFAVLQSDDQLGKAVVGEIAMTCLVTMVVLMGAINAKTKSPMVPFLVGCTVLINILAGRSSECLCSTGGYHAVSILCPWASPQQWPTWESRPGGEINQLPPSLSGLLPVHHPAALARALLGSIPMRACWNSQR
ncbi:hypothetical protein LDENG_00107950 [Lucifuga dentata]|nr:hypothetical protein LDENG_00107950 [Lucifuga dentata]